MEGIIDFTGKKILIAGASSGIGKQTAILLSKLGATIVMIARRSEAFQEIMKELYGEGHSFYISDLSDVGLIETLIKRIIAEQGKLDGLVYAAGINMSMPMNLFKPDKVQEVFMINYFGFIETVRQVCKRGRYNEGMSIVGISSVASSRGEKSHLAYSGSKAAMNSSVRCIAKEVADKGIRINTVAPAMTRTVMYSNYTESYGQDSGSNDELLKRQYLGLVEAEDVANTIAFLLCPLSRMITGITLPVDGGLTTS